MAMSASGLKTEILAQMAAKMGAPEDAAKAGNFAEAIATAIVNHLTANAKATVAASSIVTTGSAATQTGPAAPVLCAIT